MSTKTHHVFKERQEERNRKEWERRAIASLSNGAGIYEWIMATQGLHRRAVRYINGHLELV